MGCFGLLILGFVIFVIIRASNQKGNQNGKTASNKKSQNMTNQSLRQNQSIANQSMRQNQPIGNQSARQSRTAGEAAGYGQENRTGTAYTKSAETAKQQELKNRLQLKYGGASLKPQETQIVEKRKEANVVQLPEPPADNLIQEINDLMVKGYDGEMTFSRDFVAEGIEMLNRIQM